ncbi:MAG: SphA family protein [Hyphomicrobiales bacterium]
MINCAIVTLGLALVAAPSIAHADNPRDGVVQTGHYIPGWNAGLGAGTVTEAPGVYFGSTTHFYDAGTTRDGAGNKIPGAPDVESIITELAMIGRPDIKILGADYQFIIAPSFSNFVAGNPLGLSDSFIEPVRLGWHFGDLDVSGGFGIFAPTGRFTLDGSNNTGQGFWSFMPHALASYRSQEGIFDGVPFRAMGAVRYEFHSNQQGHDFVPGQNVTFEYGAGLELTEQLTAGVLGYSYLQTTDASGSAARPVDKYSAHGIGATISYAFSNFDMSLRVYRDYAVRNGPEGTVAYLEVGFGGPFKKNGSK